MGVVVPTQTVSDFLAEFLGGNKMENPPHQTNLPEHQIFPVGVSLSFFEIGEKFVLFLKQVKECSKITKPHLLEDSVAVTGLGAKGAVTIKAQKMLLTGYENRIEFMVYEN